MLYGRGAEQAQLAELLDAARAGRAGALVVLGEPGVGKSALLEQLATDADDVRVLRGQGVESELPLAFAGLHHVLQPLLPLMDRLPGPQQRALRTALGEEEGAAVDPFLVSLGTLTLLTEAGEQRPVLCLVDDAHWLDTASADALLFAARRLHADPIAFVFAARAEGPRTFTADGIPTLFVSGLDLPAVRALLAERSGRAVADRVTELLLEQTGGNPLALLELPGTLSADQLAGNAPMPAQLTVTDGVQRVFLDRCRRLSASVQTLMLIASADDSGRLLVVRRAAEQIGVESSAFDDAERAGLLTICEDALRVRHPLVRSAMYQAATARERSAAHRALADVLGSLGDPDRQAWHRAAAAEGPDDSVAAALATAAGRAERRGGYAAAAAGFQRAAELTTSEAQRAVRSFAAARNAWASGSAERAAILVEEARTSSDDVVLLADIDRLRGRMEANIGSAVRAYRIFARGAQAVAPVDVARGLDLGVAAGMTHLYNAEAHELPTSELVPIALMTVAADDTARTRCLKHLLAAINADAAAEWPVALGSLSAALEASSGVTDLDVLSNLGNAALHLGDEAGHRGAFTRMVSIARDLGAGMSVMYGLPRLAFGQLLAGQWLALRQGAVEGVTLGDNLGQRTLGTSALTWLTFLAAVQGGADYDELREELDVALKDSLGVLADPLHDLSRWAAGIRSAQAGEAADALLQLRRLRQPVLQRMAALDRFEAAFRADDRAQAEEWVKELAEVAEGLGWAWAHGGVAYGRALLAPQEQAPALYEDAISHYTVAHRPFELARAHLSYGEFLRRSQRRVDSREHLRTALAGFEDLGAVPLATRAAQELRASGETARKRDPSTFAALTPMELEVAKYVAQGLSNKEVAAKLWISPRTVAFHLRGSFAKLQVSSRGELAQLQLEAPST